MVRVEEVIDHTPTVRTLVYTSDSMSSALPGQFAMVWVPGIGELPMSIMVAKGKDRAAFTVRRHGHASTGMYHTKEGGLIGIRGPYGNSFDVRTGRLLLVGGGTGLVPMMRLLTHVRRDDDITVLIGARTKEEVFFDNLAGSLLDGTAHEVIVCTDNGTAGRKGPVTDLVEELAGRERYDAVYACGPELMMYKTVQSAHSRGMFVQASLERMMKCGVGICGSCCMAGDLVCRDGTVFDGNHLSKNADFGHIYRDKSGTPRNYQAQA